MNFKVTLCGRRRRGASGSARWGVSRAGVPPRSASPRLVRAAVLGRPRPAPSARFCGGLRACVPPRLGAAFLVRAAARRPRAGKGAAAERAGVCGGLFHK